MQNGVARRQRADGLQTSSFTYNAAIGAASRAGKWRQGLSLLDEMTDEAELRNDSSVRPTVHTYTALLRACSFAGQWRPAQALLRRMEDDDMPISAAHFGSAIEACAKQRDGSAAEARRLLVEMAGAGVGVAGTSRVGHQRRSGRATHEPMIVEAVALLRLAAALIAW